MQINRKEADTGYLQSKLECLGLKIPILVESLTDAVLPGDQVATWMPAVDHY